MSILVSGPRRLYAFLIFWERLTEPCETCPASIVRAGHGLGSPSPGPACHPACRLVLRAGLQRLVGRRLIGFKLLVLDPQG